MKVLITGGGGFIGTHVVRAMLDDNHDVVIYDNFVSSGPPVDHQCHIVFGSIRDLDRLSVIMEEQKPDLVIHLAARSDVGEGNENPSEYYQTNVTGTYNVLEAMIMAGCRKIIFASSSTVYKPSNEELTEESPLGPVSTYGRTKLACEHMIESYQERYSLNAINLRLFNVIGASPPKETGDRTIKKQKLVPCVIEALMQQHKKFKVYGSSGNTCDGTCLRDYVHVLDVAEAFRLASFRINQYKTTQAFNVGTERCLSVLEVIDIATQRAKKDFVGRDVEFRVPEIEMFDPRPGDMPMTVSNCSKIKDHLAWSARREARHAVNDSWSFALYFNNPTGPLLKGVLSFPAEEA